MIKTPVEVYSCCEHTNCMLDANGDSVDLDEAAKIINIHDNLIAVLQDVKDFTDWFYNKKYDGMIPAKKLPDIERNIEQLLEKCK